MNNFSKAFWTILFFSFLIRLAVMIWSFNFRENTDVLRYRDWAGIAHIYSLKDTYNGAHLTFGTIPNTVPPGSLYVIVLMYELQIVLVKTFLHFFHTINTVWVNGIFMDTSLRLPLILADLLIGILIFKVVAIKKSQKHAVFAASLFLFNPVIIYNSSFWGQMDSLNNLFFYIALFLLLQQKYFFATTSFFLSLFIKLSVLFQIPFFFLLLFTIEKKKAKIFISSLFSVIVILVLTLPISWNPIAWFINFFKNNSIGEMKNITAFAFNFWWVVFKPLIKVGPHTDAFNFSEIRLYGSPLSSEKLFGLPLFYFGVLLFTISTLPFIKLILNLKQKIMRQENFFLLFSVSSLLAFLFLPHMHERYLYPLFPLLATYIGITGKQIWTFILLSFFNLLNLYIVWHPFLYPSLPYSLMTNQSFQWSISIGLLITGLIFYIYSLKSLYGEK